MPSRSLRAGRATSEGTDSAAGASTGVGLCRREGYNLIGREEFPGRMLRVDRKTRVVTASLLRVLERGEPECNGAHDGH